MRAFAFGWLLGDLTLQQFSQLPSVAWIIALSPLPWLWQWRFLRLLCGGLLGFCWALLFAHVLLADRIDPTLEGRDLSISGYVEGLPQYGGDRVQLNFHPVTVNWLDRPGSPGALHNLPGHLRLSWYRPNERLYAGQFWRLRVRLKRPSGFMNAAGFDYEAWLFRRGIGAVGYVRDKPGESGAAQENRLLHQDEWSLDGMRQRLSERMAAKLPGAPMQGLIRALSVGDVSAVSAAQWQVLQATGTNHLMSISGLHIALVAGFAFFFIRVLLSRCTRCCLFWPAGKFAAVAGIVAAIVYAALAGFSIPTQRSLVMLLVVMLGQLRDRRYLPSQVIALALILVLALNPLAVLDAGFWLSFVAVAGLLLGMSARGDGRDFWRRWIKPQYVVFVGLGPLLLMIFSSLPLLSPVANVVAIPWVSFLTVPASLLGLGLIYVAPDLAGWSLNLAAWSLEVLWPLLEVLAPDWSIYRLSSSLPVWIWMITLVGACLCLMPAGSLLRGLAPVMMLPLFWPVSTALEPGRFLVTLLDVGQGLSVVVETRQHVLVYDTGARFSENFDAASAVILPFLQRRGWSRMDRLILSHSDHDHAGAVDSLLDRMEVLQIVASWPFTRPPRKVDHCRDLPPWQWDGVSFEFLHPSVEDGMEFTDNNGSCVLRVSTGQHSFLLPGDIEQKVEQRLLQRHGLDKLRAELLLVPHHGSKTSSSHAFIAAVNPRWAVASLGYRNRFGHPHATIVERYLQYGIAFLTTSHYGAMTFLFGTDIDTSFVSAERLDRRRYWHRVDVP